MFYSPPVSQSSTSQLCHQSFKQSQISTQIIESSQPSSHQPNSQISPQLLNKQKSDEFTRIKETGDYRYLQQQLCNTDLFKHIEGENFFENIPTPFGMVKVFFKYCPKDNRYIRFVPKGGTYKGVIDFLNSKIEPEKRKEIFEIILKYMQFDIKGSSSIDDNLMKCLSKIFEDHKSLFEYIENKEQCIQANTKLKPKMTKEEKIENETNAFPTVLPPKGKIMDKLACLCAFLTFCDPCYGTKIAGGAETRGFLRIIVKKSQHDFIILLNGKVYFFSQKSAYNRARNHIEGKIIDKDIDALCECMSDLHNSIMNPDSTQPIEEVVPSSQASSRNPSASSSIFKQPENDGLGLSVIEF